MKKRIATVAAATVLTLAALPALAQNVAVVNGKPIPKTRLDTLENLVKEQSARLGGPVPPEVQKQLRDELIQREIFAQEAERQGIPATPEFRNQLDLMRQTVLINMLFANYLKQHPVSDADAKAYYDDAVKQMAAQNGTKEYKASHILVKTEEQAKDVIGQIKKGAKFADLAKKYSQDPGSAAQGGDLGWANPKTYDPTFADAMTKLGKGQMTDAPVKTQFGYHIIRLEDIRDTAPPSFNDVKPQIVQKLEQEKLAAFQKELHDKAKIE